ncbi:MAG: hypothetical protein ACLR3S_06630 [Clostridium fessum]
MRRIWENRAGAVNKLLHTEYCNRQDLLRYIDLPSLNPRLTVQNLSPYH